MSTYPGENPQTPNDGSPNEGPPADETGHGATEPTQPVGYWERQAAEQARDQVPPTTAYPQGGQQPQDPQNQPYPQSPDPYGQQNAYPAPGHQAYGGQPTAGQSYYYPPVPGQLPYGYPAVAPAHSQATLAMVLGLVGLIGALFSCGLTLVVSPFAWFIGHKSVREIRSSHGRLGGESQARTGMITGIIGTVLLVLAIIAVIGLFALAIASDSSSGTGSSI